jgi:hypothetical protein
LISREVSVGNDCRRRATQDVAAQIIGVSREISMISGLTTFTFVHVVLSLIGIFSGFVVVLGLLTARRLDGWTALFLAF